MKNTNTCPKCGSRDILKIPGYTGAYGSGNNIPLTFSTVKVHRYLCCNCGFSEEWVNVEDIPRLENKFKR